MLCHAHCTGNIGGYPSVFANFITVNHRGDGFFKEFVSPFCRNMLDTETTKQMSTERNLLLNLNNQIELK